MLRRRSSHSFSSAVLLASPLQATRHARRVYVGGLPPTPNEQSVATLFSKVMDKSGGNVVGPGDALVNVYINHDKKFAFVVMRFVEKACNAMTMQNKKIVLKCSNYWNFLRTEP